MPEKFARARAASLLACAEMKTLSLFAFIACAVCSAVRAEPPEVSSDISRTPAGETIIHLSFLTNAAPEKLWRALTVADELVKWVAPKVRVELKVGGFYEYYYKPDRVPGKRGMEGAHIINYIPGKMFSHTGPLPDTWVVWTIEPAGDQQILHYYAVGTTAEWSDTAGARISLTTQMLEKLAKYVQP